ncbi:polysaccharide export protein [Rhizobiales bacterium L72]|uniref:Polysaccharide export protein n=1 Tax=Propylenella binzhouense TaxID=2555902 RepID=A0A964WTY5_9HYPH|nr:polysaccharide export protein [Propylenella binzhouense]
MLVNWPPLLRTLLLCAVLAGLGGCAGERPPLASASATVEGPYRLDSGDVLRVVVFDQPSLTNTYRVDQAGNVALPLIGDVAARNATTDELQARIAQRLGSTVLRKPDVTIEVANYRPFFVLGEVGAPGQYEYVPGMTAETAIAAAGGFTARANERTVRISRTVDGKLYEGRIAVVQPIRPGDTIYVSERLF